jgi:hypothetical protein
MPKAKWSIDSSEPEELEQYEPYDGDLPPLGVYYGKIFRLTVEDNKNGDRMLTVGFRVDDPRKNKKRFNGYAAWDRLNITEQSKPFVLLFLKALGLTWADFWNKTIEEAGEGRVLIKSIGRKKFNLGEGNPVRVQLRSDTDQAGEPSRRPGWLPWLDPSDSEHIEDDDEDEDEDDLGEEEDEDYAEDDEPDTNEESELREELGQLSRAQLIRRAKQNELTVKRGIGEEDLIGIIVAAELADEEDEDEDAEEDEDEDEDEDEASEEDDLRNELLALTRGQLVTRARAAGVSPIKKSHTERDLIDLIVEAEGEEPDEDEAEEEEPEPPRKGAAKKAPAKKATTTGKTRRKAPF